MQNLVYLGTMTTKAKANALKARSIKRGWHGVRITKTTFDHTNKVRYNVWGRR